MFVIKIFNEYPSNNIYIPDMLIKNIFKHIMLYYSNKSILRNLDFFVSEKILELPKLCTYFPNLRLLLLRSKWTITCATKIGMASEKVRKISTKLYTFADISTNLSINIKCHTQLVRQNILLSMPQLIKGTVIQKRVFCPKLFSKCVCNLKDVSDFEMHDILHTFLHVWNINKFRDSSHIFRNLYHFLHLCKC